MKVIDQLQRSLIIEKLPQRIVSLVPSQTELLVDLGLQDRLVGVTKFCVHPEQLRSQCTVVGGTKQVHLDRISGLHPDLIIANKEENTREMVRDLEVIAPVWVSDIQTIADACDMMAQLGDLLGVSDNAKAIVQVIESEQQRFRAWISGKPSLKVAYLIWKNPWMAAGSDTFISELLQLNQFENICSQLRYPEVSLEQLSQADLVLLSSEPFPFKTEHCEVLQQQIGKPVRLVDGEYFSWYGSRLQKAFRYFETLH